MESTPEAPAIAHGRPNPTSNPESGQEPRGPLPMLRTFHPHVSNEPLRAPEPSPETMAFPGQQASPETRDAAPDESPLEWTGSPKKHPCAPTGWRKLRWPSPAPLSVAEPLQTGSSACSGNPTTRHCQTVSKTRGPPPDPMQSRDRVPSFQSETGQKVRKSSPRESDREEQVLLRGAFENPK